MASAKKLWSYSVGERGINRVRAYEKPTGLLFLEFYDRPEIGLISTRQRISLGNRDRDAAKAKAEEVAAALRRNERPKSAKLTLKSLFDIYESEVTPTKGASAQHHDRFAFKLFFRIFKPMREVHTLSRRDWDHYIRVRRTGQLEIKGGKKNGVRNRMIAHDLQVLTAALIGQRLLVVTVGNFYLNETH